MHIPEAVLKGGWQGMTNAHLINIGVVLSAGLKESDAKLICECLSFAERHCSLALIHVTLVADQDLQIVALLSGS